MGDQIVITEKASQAQDVRAAVGSRYGAILPAEGHLFDLLEPEDVVPAWKRWSPILLRPEGVPGEFLLCPQIVSVRALHVGQGLTGVGVQFQGRRSSSRLMGWPSVMRLRTSLRYA